MMPDFETPRTLEEAASLKDGPVSKFYMLKYAPRGTDKMHLKTLSCKEIREALGL